MKKIIWLFLALSMLLMSCSKSVLKDVKNTAEAEAFVSEVSPTMIPRNADILISFTREITGNIDKALSIVGAKGKWEKVDDKTVRFISDTPFKSSAEMQLCADLKKLFGTDKELKYYHNFIAEKADFSLDLDGFEIIEGDSEFTLSGTLNTDIPETLETAKKMLSVSYSTKTTVEWDESEATTSRYFIIKGIEQGEATSRTLRINWSGKAMGSNKVINNKYKIAARDTFDVIDINRKNDNTILVSFSNRLEENQDLDDIIIAHAANGFKAKIDASINANILTFYTDGSWQNVAILKVQDNLRNSNYEYLASMVEIISGIEWEKPEIRFMNEGTIIPTSRGTNLVVGTKNLSALLIQAYAIYDHNMTQFLQVNELDGEKELYRVGEPVWEKKVSLDWKDEYANQTVPHPIDVSELVKKYPNGMFQIRITFRKDDIKYVCRDNHRDFSNLPFPPDTIGEEMGEEESSWWDYYNDMDYDDRRTFWNYDDDPCHPAFYMPRYNSRCLIKRNILISDLGIMAKGENNKGEDLLHITVADLKSAKPVANADVDVVSFVGSKLASGKTDKDGNFVAKVNNKAFAVIASYNNQSSYLKLNAANMLSIDHFEVGGEIAKDGVKGAIYGERGVWRPGDKIYLTFVLQDENKTLPENIPVLFELTDPLGRITQQKTMTSGINGFYAIETKTDKDSVTGLWSAKIKVGGNEWKKSLRVEAVVPNRLAINLEASSKILEQGRNEFKLSGAWLHGAPIPNYKADVSVAFTPARTMFDGYGEYTFSNPMKSYWSSRETIWEGELDKDSKAEFSERLEIDDNAPGMMKANMVSRIFEPSGAFSTQSTTFDYSPYDRYVGLKLPKGDAARGMLLTDTDHTCDVALLNADGSKCTQGELRYSVYKLEWKWWWEKDALTSSSFVSSESSSLIDQGEFSVKDGAGSFTLRVNYPSWGRYLVVAEDPNGHSAGKIVYIDWPGWAGRAQEGGTGSASSVTLICDKKQYTVGENAAISFASGENGRALVTIEKNGSVLKQEWLETKKDTTVYKLPLTSEMSPNVYVHITLLQQHQQTANSLPIRLFGVVPVMVDNPATKLEPVITTADTYEPNKDVSVSISEKNGKPMTYTVAVVDEGLLGLTNYHAPNLRAEFYKKEASQIKNWDLYRYVMNAYSGNLESLLLVGGSDEGDNRERDSNRFTPIVKFFGPYTLEAGQKSAISYNTGEYIGAVRTIVIAGGNGAYGSAEKTSAVKADLMLQPSIPRTLGTKENIDTPLTIFNGTDKEQTYSVTLKASGSVTFNETKSIKVGANSNATIPFSVKTDKAGKADFIFTASASGKSAESKTSVDVLSRGLVVTYRTPFELDGGKSKKVSVPSPMEEVKLDLELSTFPAINLDERLSSLITYPHGCIEQITSGGFPQIYIPNFLKLSPEQADSVKANVKSVIERYNNYQTSSGGMGYWPGNSEPHEWGSCYALHFLTEARRNGYLIKDSLYEPLISYVEDKASKWSRNDMDYTIQAYRVFDLALAGRANISAMNRLKDSIQDMDSAETKMLLAASYALSGRKKIAKDIADNLKISFSSKNNRLTGYTFHSMYRERAIWLFVDTILGGSKNSLRIAKEIGETLSSERWLNTQEISWSLIALIPYYQGSISEKASYEVKANGKTYKDTLSSNAVIVSLEGNSNEKQQEIEVKNTDKASLFGTLCATGRALAGEEKEKADGLELYVRYYRDDKRVTPNELKIGDTFKIEIVVDNETSSDCENIALTLPIPTCWEINNDRIGSDDEDNNSSYDYQDFKDSAVYTYFSLDGRQDKTFQFSATVAYTGSYYVPAITAESMYDNSYSALMPGTYVDKKYVEK